jgi:hypothetical protein
MDKRYAGGYRKIQEVYVAGAWSGRVGGPLAENG